MCKNIEKVLEEATGMPISCTVVMDNDAHVSDDFVCVMSRENGDASIFYNTDALTLGMSMKMIAKAFVDAMGALPEEERAMVSDILGDSFFIAKPEGPEVIDNE